MRIGGGWIRTLTGARRPSPPGCKTLIYFALVMGVAVSDGGGALCGSMVARSALGMSWGEGARGPCVYPVMRPGMASPWDPAGRWDGWRQQQLRLMMKSWCRRWTAGWSREKSYSNYTPADNGNASCGC